MWFPRLLTRRRGANRIPIRRRPTVEVLEDRHLLSTGIVPNDPLFMQQWGLDVTQADLAWNLTTGSTQVTVAVVDNGIDYTHPDLYQNIWLNQEEIPAAIRAQLTDVDGDGLFTFWDLNEPVNQGPGKITDLNGTGFIDGGDLLRTVAEGGWADGLDNGGNGLVDDLIGWDFFDNDNDPMEVPQFLPDDYHGTAVAGIIGAVGNNGEGIAGINWQVQIMPARFYPTTDFSVLFRPDVFNAFLTAYVKAGAYAVNNGARVVNFTGAAPESIIPEEHVVALSALLDQAVARDVLFVTTSGSLGVDTGVVPHLPGGLPHDNIINLAATLRNDHLISLGNTSFPGNNWASNWGPTTVDLAGPGDHVWAPVPQSLPGILYDARMNGTSAAAPHVTGTAALIFSINPNLTFAEVKALILDNVDVVPDLVGKTVTGGRLNIYRAVSAALPGDPLLASSVGNGTTETLTVEQVTPLLAEAVARWQASGVDTSGLGAIDIRNADLGGTTLGMAAAHTIWLDDNAAGWGWFIDPTPWDDSEFTTPGDQGEQGKMDLLAALAHEIGHLLGQDHADDGVMAETLMAGSRRMPLASTDADWLAAVDVLFSKKSRN